MMNETGSHYLLVIQTNVQIYDASDNNTCLSTLVMPSRVNQASFTKLNNSTSEPNKSINDGDLNVICICENKVLYIHNVEGQQVCFYFYLY